MKQLRFIYLVQKNLLVKAIMDSCFSLNPVYVFQKGRLCAAGKLKTLCTR